MTGAMFAFIVFATIAFFGSLMVILKRNPVASAFALILVLFSFAGIYAILGAHFVAALQILLYTGAIMVLFVFVIMLLNSDEPENDLKKSSLPFKAVTALSLVGFGAVLVKSILSELTVTALNGPWTLEKIAESGGNVRVISEQLFTRFVFHFELVSFLVLAAVVATVSLHKRNKKSVNNRTAA
jgi:NADH-quinone oxidoreductase subunit J